MPQETPKSRTPLFLTLIATGVFLVGAALIPLLVHGQEAALEKSGVTRPPVISNQTAPQLVLTDLQGNTVSLGNSFGKVILLNNWATWCPPCQAEMPELQAFYLAHADQNFVVIAIDSGESTDIVTRFIRQHGVTFPVWLDPHTAALDAFQNWNLPSSYVLDRQGTIRMSWTGPVNQATLEKYITLLLEK